MLWTLSLSRKGIDLEQTVTTERLWKIQNLMLNGNLREAATLVDQAYADLERAFNSR